MNKNTILKNLIDKKKNNEIIQDKIEKDRIADLLKNLEKTNKKLNQDSSKLDICVIMFYTENIKDYANINYKINKMYCEKYNIDIILSHDLFYTQRTVHWERLPLLLKYIKNKSIIYDYGILQHFNENHIINIGIKPFILHLPGKNNKERLDISLNYYNKINFS
jgi:hypothetical protein